MTPSLSQLLYVFLALAVFLVVAVVLVAVAVVEKAIAVVMVKVQRYVTKLYGKRATSECVGEKKEREKVERKMGVQKTRLTKLLQISVLKILHNPGPIKVAWSPLSFHG